MAKRREIWSGVFHYQAEQWRTNSLLFLRSGEALVVDPAFTRQEITAIREHAMSGGGPTYLMLSHADNDHTVGFGMFPEAEIVLEDLSAELFNNGAAEAQLRGALAEWKNEDVPVELRWDRTFAAGDQVECGSFRIDTIPAPGHVPDGVVLVFREEGIMVVGDYLCATFAPLVFGSVTAYRQSTERMLSALDTVDLRWVVPGHGPLLSPDQASEMARRDIQYLDEVRNVATTARDEGWSYGAAMSALMEVAPPRGSEGDITYYSPQVMLAKTALSEVGISRPDQAVAVWGP